VPSAASERAMRELQLMTTIVSKDRAQIGPLIKDLWRTVGLLASAVPGVMTGLVFWAMVEAVTTVALPYSTKRLIDAVGASRATGFTQLAIIWLVVELVLGTGRTVAQRWSLYATQVLQSRGGRLIISMILEKACKVPYPKFEDTRFVNKLVRARQDAAYHGVGFGVQFVSIGRSIVIFVGCLALLAVTASWSIPLLILARLPAFWADKSAGREMFALEQQHLHRNRQGWYYEWLLTDELNAKEIRSLGLGLWLVGRFRAVHEAFSSGHMQLATKHLRRSLAPMFIGALGSYGPYLVVVIHTVSGKLSVGDMLLFSLAFQQGSMAFSQVLNSVARAMEQHLYVRDLLEVLDEAESEPESPPRESQLITTAPELVIEDLWFTYPGSTTPVLRGLNLTVRPGETLAIIGQNGIGKSTLVKLLIGLYPIDRGRILLGGIDVATRDLAWRRANIGVVFQDSVRFHFSMRWNVGVGWVPDVDNSERVQRSLEMADAGSLVGSQPNGIDSALGTAFGGRDVSGGQWQRIALARLFMRPSRLWVLDEPTSAMDPEAEERTFHRFREWTSNRTAILIAHRFSTVRIADRIALIQDGRTSEIGTHEELLAADGQYAQLFRLQSQSYVPGGGPRSGSEVRFDVSHAEQTA
jgi:ATP-binding cassette subfamily B protein